MIKITDNLFLPVQTGVGERLHLFPSSNTPDSGGNGSLFGLNTCLQPNEMVVAALLHSPAGLYGLVGASAFWNLPSATRSGRQVKPRTPPLPDRTGQIGRAHV